VQQFTPLLADAPGREDPGGNPWFVNETNVKVGGAWRYVYRASDQHGRVVDTYLFARRDPAAAGRFFTALSAHGDRRTW
jgi:transposase-like protein